jgi:tRNA nucleotidyltransferase (CCA-adding enzyme)
MFTYYKVGGCVRDHVMGVRCKDIDLLAIGGSFDELEKDVISQGGVIYISKPEFLTIRCNYPKIGPCDIRLARKDGDYSDGRRPDKVFLADDVRDDINTRDFTMNALLQDLESGEVIDYVGGLNDIQNRTINTVGDAVDRFEEDYLRLLRAVRFSITKGFDISLDIHDCLMDAQIIYGLKNVSIERIYEELFKCFKHDTLATLKFLEEYSELRDMVFDGLHCGPLWLKPTLEVK